MPSINRIAHLFSPEPEPTVSYVIMLDLPETGDLVFGRSNDRAKAASLWKDLASACTASGRKLPRLLKVDGGTSTEIDPNEEGDTPAEPPTEDVLQVVLFDGEEAKPFGEPRDLHSALHLMRLETRHALPGRLMLRLVRDGDQRLDDLRSLDD